MRPEHVVAEKVFLYRKDIGYWDIREAKSTSDVPSETKK